LNIRQVHITRYITPLREGGSLPAIVEADDAFLYVLKFRGAGQGTKALIADFVGGEIARKLGFRVPEMVFAQLDDSFGRTEPDEEIQDLLKFSVGLNLGVHYLSGAITFDPVLHQLSEEMSSQIVWLDAFLTNVDRTPKNTNMLMWHKELWLIDHGASLYFHHNWDTWEKHALSPFKTIKDHVLLKGATELSAVDARAKEILTDEFIDNILASIPSDWLVEDEDRKVYGDFLKIRLKNSGIFVKEAEDARKALI
jgi:hypothetical protein